MPIDLSAVAEPEAATLRALDEVEYGDTITYGRLAIVAGDTEPQAAQRVGIAMARNPLLILVPCHRVVGADGGLRGYRGGITRKRALLDLEAAGTVRSTPKPSAPTVEIS